MRAPGRALASGVAAVALVAVLAAGCSKDEGSEERFCARLAVAPTLDSVVSGFSDAEPGELDTRLADASDAYQGLHDVAPSEVRGDVGTVVEVVDAVIEAVQDHRDDPEVVADQVRAAVKAHPGTAAAATKVAAYAAEHCKLQLNPTVDDVTSTTEAATTSSTAGG